MRRVVVALAIAVAACAPGSTPQSPTPERAAGDTTQRGAPGAGAISTPNADPFPSTYRPFPSRPTVIRNVTIMTGMGPRIEGGSVLMQ
ncbi:MAG: amidohydrolase, partial [Gemmatimonadaceae bacterium]